jgi:acid phosphatase (class A)
MRTIIYAAIFGALASAANAQTPQSLIDGAALVGPPPAAESAQGAADRLAMRPAPNEARMAQAVSDLAFDPWQAFAPALGENFTAERFPATALVLTTLTRALAGPVNGAKTEYDRPRPYAADRRVLQCDDPGPDVSTTGSYPTGHGAAGWAWALTLAELAPARADAILQRGRDFGESRIICGYHFPSDVDAGRLIAAGVVARLHADAAFRRALDAARREMTRAYAD